MRSDPGLRARQRVQILVPASQLPSLYYAATLLDSACGCAVDSQLTATPRSTCAANDDIVAVAHGEACELATNMASADESNGLHNQRLRGEINLVSFASAGACATAWTERPRF